MKHEFCNVPLDRDDDSLVLPASARRSPIRQPGFDVLDEDDVVSRGAENTRQG